MSDGAISLEFDSVGGGLIPAKPGDLNAFAIAGRDRVWHWARARIENEHVILSSRNVQHPVAARYAWSMNPSQRSLLYNQEGLPASPFRTDDWPLMNQDAEVVDVIKPAKPSGYQARDWQRPRMSVPTFSGRESASE